MKNYTGKRKILKENGWKRNDRTSQGKILERWEFVINERLDIKKRLPLDQAWRFFIKNKRGDK